MGNEAEEIAGFFIPEYSSKGLEIVTMGTKQQIFRRSVETHD